MSTPEHAAAPPAAPLESQIVDLLRDFTAETTPGAAAKIPDYRAHLRPGTAVYITFLPGSDFDDTLATAVRLRREGFEPVPHLSARSLPGRAYLDDRLARLVGEAGVEHVLAIAGAVPEPVGEFSDTMELLDTGLLDRHGIRRIGVAGHPEGSPDMSEEAIRDALAWKNAFAARTDASMYVVTQFCFKAEPLIAWDRHLREDGNRLPIRVGVPGLATIKALLAHAKACGVGPSMTFVARQARNVAKLLTVSAPDALIADLARYRAADPQCGIAGVHMYPLGGLRRTAEWTYAVLDGRFTLERRRSGFRVELDAA